MMPMLMLTTNKLSAVSLISYSAPKIPRVLPLLSYYTFGRGGEMITNMILFVFGDFTIIWAQKHWHHDCPSEKKVLFFIKKKNKKVESCDSKLMTLRNLTTELDLLLWSCLIWNPHCSHLCDAFSALSAPWWPKTERRCSDNFSERSVLLPIAWFRVLDWLLGWGGSLGLPEPLATCWWWWWWWWW